MASRGLPGGEIRKFKLVFLGDQQSGKTAIIQRAITDTFPKEYAATIGVDFVSKTMKIELDDEDEGESGGGGGGERKGDDPPGQIRLQLWDTAGQERFKASIPSYIRDSHVAVITFDISSREQFDNMKKWIDEVREIRGEDCVIWMVATKVDVPLYDRKVSWLEMEKLAQQKKLQMMECSAKAGYNIRELFIEMTHKLPKFLADEELKTHSARF